MGCAMTANRWLTHLVVAFVVLAFCGWFGAAVAKDNRSAPALPLDWKASGDRDHSLVGAIYDVRARAFVDADVLAKRLALARFPLLGEIHDNADHHLWQAWAIRAISKIRGSRIVEGAPQIDMIAMEMLTTDQYAGIDKFYGRDAVVPRKRKPRAFGRLVGWDKSGWPDFEIYEPIIAQAQYEQIVIVPALGGKDGDREVSKKGLLGYLGAKDLSRLALSDPLPPPLYDDLIAEIGDSHCGLLPDKAFPRMAEVQRFRDATMADALLSAGDWKGAILIAGNGHVRLDRGVAHYLVERGVEPNSIVALGLKEVVAGKSDPEAYPLRNAAGEPIYDYVAFTPRVERPDPCERMRASFGKSTDVKKKTTN